MAVKSLFATESINMGCDPEIFVSYEVGKIRKRKSVIGSESILEDVASFPKHNDYGGNVARDGIQLELHPPPSYCRESLSVYISSLVQHLQKKVTEASIKLNIPNLAIDFRSVVRLTPGDMSRISAESRRLGCVPSNNVYGAKQIAPKNGGSNVMIRSAAGHIHLGASVNAINEANVERMIKFLDVMAGIPMVLVDRDPLAAQRRRLYGRAGEYRVPKNGEGNPGRVEWRTPSNFWLRNYQLMSMMFGLVRMAFYAACADASSQKHRNYYTGLNYMTDVEANLFKNVNLADVERAINLNDFDLALKVWETAVKPFYNQLSAAFNTGLDSSKVGVFETFVNKIREAELAGNPDPLSAWFSPASVENWHPKSVAKNGWESYLEKTVRPTMTSKAFFTGVVSTPKIDTNLVTPSNPIIMPSNSVTETIIVRG